MTQKFNKIQPHEYVMSFAFAYVLVRLLLNGVLDVQMMGPPALLIVSYWALIYFGREDRKWMYRLRYFWNVILMNYLFTAMREMIPAMGIEHTVDAGLVLMDALILGGDPSLFAQKIYHPVLTEIMSAAYFSFLIFLGISFIRYALGEPDRMRRFYTGIFMLYMVAIILYTIYPAVGPREFLLDQYTRELNGFFITDMNRAIVNEGSARFDAFPSLHMGGGLYLLLFYAKYDRRWLKLYTVPFVLIVLSTMYLRYHYFVDLIPGAALSAGAFVLSEYFLSPRAESKVATSPLETSTERN